MLQLHSSVVNAKRGPYLHTAWLDNMAKNLDPSGAVHLVKENETQNYIQVRSETESLRFAPFVGTLRSERYRIHRKGPERVEAPSCNPSLFELQTDETERTPAELYPYALLIRTSMAGSAYYELHLFLGDQPMDSTAWQSGIRHYGLPYIVRMPEEGGTTTDEMVPFSPDPM